MNSIKAFWRKPQYRKTAFEKRIEDEFETSVCFKTCTVNKNQCEFLWRKLEHLSSDVMEPCIKFESFLKQKKTRGNNVLENI